MRPLRFLSCRPVAIGAVPVALLLLALFASAPRAQTSARFMTAGELHQRLSAEDPAAREAGRHYVLGVVDTLALVRDPNTCLGPGVSSTRLVEVVAAQLQARPDLHRYNAASLVREALSVAFRCT
jgi:hypothetical protein